MQTYWCVNFETQANLQHGIDKKLWMMQYQYADDLGHVFQDGRQRSATTRNWNRMKDIEVGDKFVAYLPAKESAKRRPTFYATGTVIGPRSGKSPPQDHVKVDEYVKRKRSHDQKTGFKYYTPVFYEDFTDNWRFPKNPLIRYAQRVDVDDWRHYVPEGVLVGDVDLSSRKKNMYAAFPIDEDEFDRIEKQLAAASVLAAETNPGNARPEDDDDVVDALEKAHARSQGFLLDSKLRKAIEGYAMDQAKRYFTSRGYSVNDDSKRQPYDLHCEKKREELYVEVKGTQTNGACIVLTSGEVEFASRHRDQMALFVLHSIKLSGDGATPAGGVKKLVQPWDVDRGRLRPISFFYDV
jgi:hypothetical protein